MLYYIMIITNSKKNWEAALAGFAGARAVACRMLGGATCLTLLVQCGLVCFLRHYLSNSFIDYFSAASGPRPSAGSVLQGVG